MSSRNLSDSNFWGYMKGMKSHGLAWWEKDSDIFLFLCCYLVVLSLNSWLVVWWVINLVNPGANPFHRDFLTFLSIAWTLSWHQSEAITKVTRRFGFTHEQKKSFNNFIKLSCTANLINPCNMRQWFPHPTMPPQQWKNIQKVRNKNSRPATMLTALVAFAGKLGAKFFIYSKYPKDSGWWNGYMSFRTLLSTWFG